MASRIFTDNNINYIVCVYQNGLNELHKKQFEIGIMQRTPHVQAVLRLCGQQTT